MNDMTRDEALAALQAITRELEDNRLTIVRQVIDMNRNVIGEYRKTVRLPRDRKAASQER